MTITATRTPRLIAASAEPERARYRARSRSASRGAIGAAPSQPRGEREEERCEQDQSGDEEHDPEHQFRRSAAAAPAVRASRVAEQQERRDEEDDAGDRRAMDLTGRGGATRERGDDRYLGDRARRPGRRRRMRRRTASTIAATTTTHGKGEHADEVVRALLEVRPVSEPDEEPENEATDGTDEANHRAVGTDDETDVAIGGPDRLEHADRAEPALRQHGEAADRDERDEEHPEHEGRKRDRFGVERVRLGDRGRRLDRVPIFKSEGTPGASNSATTCVGELTCPGVTSANSSRRLWGFSTVPTTLRSTPPTLQVAPSDRWNAEATPLVTATSSAPVG